MKEYDVIVIGAGNAGLSAAASCAKAGLRTLLLDRNAVPGGVATSFVRGRFEFEVSLHELMGIGSEEAPGEVRRLLDSLGAPVSWVQEKSTFRLVVPGELDVTMPCGCEEFADEAERQMPGSRESVAAFLELGSMAERVLSGFASGSLTPAALRRDYPDFLRLASHPLKQVLDALHMPESAQHLVSAYWPYLGTVPEELDALLYAIMLHGYVALGAGLPRMRSHELALALDSAIRTSGGDILYHAEAERFTVRDGRVRGVVVNGREIPCRAVICSAAPDHLLRDMLPGVSLPKQETLLNARQPGMAFNTLYLGMKCTAEQLGLKDYSIFIAPSADPAEQRGRMNGLTGSGYVILNCLNVAIPGCSPEGTCILYLTAPVCGDPLAEVDQRDYPLLRQQAAEDMLTRCESALGISLRPWIEEIGIATPATFARYSASPRGTPYGFAWQRWDTLFGRIMAWSGENPLPNLYLTGAHAEHGGGYSSCLQSGAWAAGQAIHALEKEVASHE